MAGMRIAVKMKQTGPGFRAVSAQFRKNAAILPGKTAANIAWVASEMAPVWQGTVNPGKGRVVGWSPHQHREAPAAHSYPVPHYLANSIQAVDNVVHVGAYYGIYVEFGTRFMHQEPFLRPACQLVYRTQFREDMKIMFTHDISTGRSVLNGAVPAAVKHHQAKHIEVKRRNKITTVSQKNALVRRRFQALRTRGLTHGGTTMTMPRGQRGTVRM